MAPPAATAPLNLGFLTVVREEDGYVGGYLVTNRLGRPLEFRLSTAVQPNRVQRILYGETLDPYLCAEVIGKALVDKAIVAAQLLLTDCRSALELRMRVEMPMLYLISNDEAEMPGCFQSPTDVQPGFCRHADYPSDEASIQSMLRGLETLDLTEPFCRIRDVIGEARKMGATNRG